MKKSKKKIRFRASKVGNLMVGGNKITETQLADLAKLQKRKDDHIAGVEKVKPLTEKMEKDLKDLIAKRDAPFELGKTAQTFIRKMWMEENHSIKDIVNTPEIMKGRLCEQDAFDLVSKVFPEDGFRTKNTENFKNELYTGTPDDLVGKIDVEDMKCSWDMNSFLAVETWPTLYLGQGQTYLDLTGRDRFRLIYCLVNTPNILLKRDFRKVFYSYNVTPIHGLVDDDGELLLDLYEDDVPKQMMEDLWQVKENHTFDHIPPENRVKVFEFHRDDAYLKEQAYRAKIGQKFYQTVQLPNGREDLLAQRKKREEALKKIQQVEQLAEGAKNLVKHIAEKMGSDGH